MTSKLDNLSLINNQVRLKRILGSIPSLPGCYLMKDNNDRFLYIGKSKNLRARVRSYFKDNNSLSARISLMVRQVYDIEFIVTDTETESLTLESNLIKQNQPYFNILLKDDKKYPYLCITWSELYPRIFITRRRRNRNIKDKYFGPYVDVNNLRNMLYIVKKILPVRQRLRPLYKDKTCLNYSIGICPGVCQELITSEDYRKTIKKVEMIFQGRTKELKDILLEKMYKHSELLEYEKSLFIKKQIEAINKITESQKMIDPDSLVNRDVIALYGNDSINCIQLFQIRSGKIIGRIAYTLDSHNYTPDVIIENVIIEHYSQLSSIEVPSEIIIEYQVKEPEVIEQWLTEIRKRQVKLFCPIRSSKKKLVELVKKNAQLELNKICQGKEKTISSLENLAELLDLPFPPKRIEGYDISHLQGSNAVGSQVVFIDGIPAKHHYRKYTIKDTEIKIGHSDDYKAIYEVITRRFRKWSLYKSQGIDINLLRDKKSSVFNPLIAQDFPDLIMIDGGKGQLNSALKALRELQLDSDINICSLAKKNEEVFLPGINHSLDCDQEDTGLYLLRRLRDEAHRFALAFHRNKRSNDLKRSDLSDIEGIGPKRIKTLLSHFNSVQAIRMARKEQIALVPGVGKELAYNIWRYFNK
ncbi:MULTISPECIES: excinuclease ABC subunit UvrC [unclassified Prochlorococcus]|uniref:excinuclease ABC subunit UvrC n=1 Tax=unclassified Prochlorococcus TaxID=2627481 RepID=UPI000533A655|nr:MULTISPECIES: excinuclease ABC subunit UvrC [unclassified Prochlorococcus]KGG15277.1 Excinuclease ABC subunit C [Prochlorococcus sp. MIT 0602]KGG17554.1 Excinuclease ABC subunit C [Prochlorococcus sp. MIT 0603]